MKAYQRAILTSSHILSPLSHLSFALFFTALPTPSQCYPDHPIYTDHLPNDLVCGKDVKEFLGDCLKGKLPFHYTSSRLHGYALPTDTSVFIYFTEFILLVSSEANEICEKDSKKTILPEHLTSALKVRLLSAYFEETARLTILHCYFCP